MLRLLFQHFVKYYTSRIFKIIYVVCICCSHYINWTQKCCLRIWMPFGWSVLRSYIPNWRVRNIPEHPKHLHKPTIQDIKCSSRFTFFYKAAQDHTSRVTCETFCSSSSAMQFALFPVSPLVQHFLLSDWQ